MTGQVCKAAICDDEAQGRMMTAIEKINSLKGASTQLRIENAELYIKYMKEAQSLCDKLVMESGE